MIWMDADVNRAVGACCVEFVRSCLIHDSFDITTYRFEMAMRTPGR